MKAAETFDNTNIKKISSGQKHLGAAIGSELYRRKYIEEIVSKWRNELFLLSKIMGIKPQAAYFVYINCLKSKYNFFNRTIPTIQNHMKSIEDVLRNHFIPTIIGESSNCYNLFQILIALPIRLLTILIALSIQCIKVAYWRYCRSHHQPKH